MPAQLADALWNVVLESIGKTYENLTERDLEQFAEKGQRLPLPARCRCAADARGGEGALVQHDMSATLSTTNNQILFQPTGCGVLPFDTTQVTDPRNGSNPQWGDPFHSVTASGHVPAIVCMGDANSRASIDYGLCGTIKVGGGAPVVQSGYTVRRLMPIECERLMGFPDGWTDIEYKGKPASDTARYKALGNSMAVPVMAWIGRRIEEVCHA